MPFHVPFHHRESNRRHYGTIHIGPQAHAGPPKKKFNWWGFNGMWLSFAALLTAGLLSPLSLLMSLMGMRRPGKKMAAVGTFTSLAGIGILTMIIWAVVNSHHHAQHRRHVARAAIVNAEKVEQTESILANAYDDLVEYRGQNEGALPDDIEGNILVVSYSDPWGEELRYEPEGDFALIRSAGPDRKFLSSDDVLTKVDSKSESRHTKLSDATF
jgi:hypothetical protein